MEIPYLSKPLEFSPSKWVHIYLFLSKEELQKLLSIYSSLYFCSLKNPQAIEDVQVTKEKLISAYEEQISFSFPKNKSPLCKILPVAMTHSLEVLYAKKITKERINLYIQKPVLVLKPLYLSFAENKVYEGKDLFWGIKISYPMLYIDPSSKKIKNGNEHENFAIFTHIRRWARKYTEPFSFIVKGEKILTPYRISSLIKQQIGSREIFSDEKMKIKVEINGN